MVMARIRCQQKKIIKRKHYFCVVDSQDVDLDAILGELCALESQYDAELAQTTPPKPGKKYIQDLGILSR